MVQTLAASQQVALVQLVLQDSCGFLDKAARKTASATRPRLKLGRGKVFFNERKGRFSSQHGGTLTLVVLTSGMSPVQPEKNAAPRLRLFQDLQPKKDHCGSAAGNAPLFKSCCLDVFCFTR